MSEKKPQTYANHGRLVPMYHGVTFGLLVVNLIYSVYLLIAAFAVSAIVYVLTAVALLLLFFYTRLFATQNQDRIIRLEERLRMQSLLPDSLKSRVDEFTVRQLVSLRFASDRELPELAQRVLDEQMDPAEVKKQIREWRPDYTRV